MNIVKKRRETELMQAALEDVGVEITSEIFAAICKGLKDIRRERHEEWRSRRQRRVDRRISVDELLADSQTKE